MNRIWKKKKINAKWERKRVALLNASGKASLIKIMHSKVTKASLIGMVWWKRIDWMGQNSFSSLWLNDFKEWEKGTLYVSKTRETIIIITTTKNWKYVIFHTTSRHFNMKDEYLFSISFIIPLFFIFCKARRLSCRPEPRNALKQRMQ